ncbi:MAG: GIY-YIG nuclease family protein [Pirellulales bacterium]|nr:GIY-YIG nuclease family protein [Pirellulales bacterium]
MDETYVVYVLRSRVTGRRYVGSTQDLDDRLMRHNSGQSKSTRSGAPWKLVHYESFPTRSAALQKEQFYKTGTGREQLDAIEQGTASISPD